jgi:Methyltransferase domain
MILVSGELPMGLRNTHPDYDLSRVSRYLTRGRKRVQGWLSRLDGEIFATLMLDQMRRGVRGGALEIGVHHGRSFSLISLCLSKDETAIAVDIFGKQNLNFDRSGNGDLAKFKANIARYGDLAKTKIIERSSLDVRPEDIRSVSPGPRFISVDGAHWYSAVLNDLRLAASCAGPDCVIALDDVFNADYPEVAAAYYAWMVDKPEFTPLCISSGKLYLTRFESAQNYRDALLRNNFLRLNCKKEITYLSQQIPVFTGRYRSLRGLVIKYLKYYSPRTFEYIKDRKTKLLSNAPAPAGQTMTKDP